MENNVKYKMKQLLEVLYNCPFILLVLLSGMLVVPASDEINVLHIDRKIAISDFAGDKKQTEGKIDDGKGVFRKEGDTEERIDQNTAGQKEDAAAKKTQAAENAGICKEEKNDIVKNKNQENNFEELENAENKGKEKYGRTEFVPYTPVDIESRYYSDAGKVALTTDYDYTLENESYFNDAVFLGDSRTLGISDYAGLSGADFFCENGMTIYKLLEDEGVTYQRTGEKMDMKKVLQEKRYGKIYIMLGMNELGYGNTLMYLKQYLKVIKQLEEWQPDAVIFIMANLHVSREKNNPETEFNNININDKNVAAARLADGRDVFYLDCNPLFTDEEGFLQAELTFDGVHLYAQHYDKWRDFLFSHGVERETKEKVQANMQEGDADGTDTAE